MINRLITPIWSLILCLFLAYSCKVDHHLNKIEHHTEKAKEKGAVFAPDTVWRYQIRFDTIIEKIPGTDSFIERLVPVVDSVFFTSERLVYVPMSRQQRKALKDSMKHEARKLKILAKMYADSLEEARKVIALQEKTIQKTNKQDNKTERTKARRWIWWIIAAILGLSVGWYLRGQWRGIKKKFDESS